MKIGLPYCLLIALVVLPKPIVHAQSDDPLPAWNDDNAKQAIVQFVETVTARGEAGFVPPDERVAVFDNDGTLWAEQPLYFQLAFTLDRIRELAPDHPEWKNRQPFRAVLENDLASLTAAGKEGLLELLVATHANTTTAEFAEIVRTWLATARHAETGRPYTEMVYQPMLELLDYLRANGFKTYIASAGGVEFMRVFAEDVYGIPPAQVIGSSIKTRYEIRDGVPAILRLPEVDFVDDKAGKPVAINKHIGRRPIAAFGNSDGDQQMLQWTWAGEGPRLACLLHHTDAEREWAYDRGSPIGGLDKAWDEANEQGWLLIDMKTDWKQIFPFGSK